MANEMSTDGVPLSGGTAGVFAASGIVSSGTSGGGRRVLGTVLEEFLVRDHPDGAQFVAEAPVVRETARRDARYKWALVAADVLAAIGAIAISLAALGSSGILRPGTALLPVIVFGGKAAGLYERDQHVLTKRTLDEAPQVFNVMAMFTLIFWLVDSAVVGGQNVTPHEVLYLLVAAFFLSMAGRAGARALVQRHTPPERCLVVGDAAAASLLARKLDCAPRPTGVVVGRVPFPSEHGVADSDETVEVVSDLGGLGLALVEQEIDRVIVAPGESDHDSGFDAIRLIKAIGVKVSVMPRLLEVVGSAVEFDSLGGITLLGVRREGLSRSSSVLKRGFDLILAGTVVTLASPLLVAIAIAIRLESSGPVLFRQRRIGRNGREFQMLKFRTMVAGAEDLRDELSDQNATDGLFKLTDDPRVTRVGRFLRAASMDELPQLLNVLRGEMSLVGPRPLIPDEDCKVCGWDRRRLYVPPGMTGHWQIMGGARVPLDEMVKIDYLYGANWSLWDDVKTLVRTIPHVALRRGL